MSNNAHSDYFFVAAADGYAIKYSVFWRCVAKTQKKYLYLYDFSHILFWRDRQQCITKI